MSVNNQKEGVFIMTTTTPPGGPGAPPVLPAGGAATGQLPGGQQVRAKTARQGLSLQQRPQQPSKSEPSSNSGFTLSSTGKLTTPKGNKYNIEELKINGKKVDIKNVNLKEAADHLLNFLRESGLIDHLDDTDVDYVNVEPNRIQIYHKTAGKSPTVIDYDSDVTAKFSTWRKWASEHIKAGPVDSSKGADKASPKKAKEAEQQSKQPRITLGLSKAEQDEIERKRKQIKATVYDNAISHYKYHAQSLYADTRTETTNGISAEDLSTVEKNWLGGEPISMYFSQLNQEAVTRENAAAGTTIPKHRFLTTANGAEIVNKIVTKNEKLEDDQGTASWLATEELFDHEKIFIPFNSGLRPTHGNHYAMAVIEPSASDGPKITIYDSCQSAGKSYAGYFESGGAGHTALTAMVRAALTKKNQGQDYSSTAIPFTLADVPQQEDLSSCGVHTCAMAYCLSREKSLADMIHPTAGLLDWRAQMFASLALKRTVDPIEATCPDLSPGNLDNLPNLPKAQPPTTWTPHHGKLTQFKPTEKKDRAITNPSARLDGDASCVQFYREREAPGTAIFGNFHECQPNGVTIRLGTKVLRFQHAEAAFHAAKLQFLVSKGKLRQDEADAIITKLQTTKNGDEACPIINSSVKDALNKSGEASNWGAVSSKIMKEIVKAKFTQNPSLAKTLVSQRGKVMIENSGDIQGKWSISPNHRNAGNHNEINVLGDILIQLYADLDVIKAAEHAQAAIYAPGDQANTELQSLLTKLQSVERNYQNIPTATAATAAATADLSTLKTAHEAVLTLTQARTARTAQALQPAQAAQAALQAAQAAVPAIHQAFRAAQAAIPEAQAAVLQFTNTKNTQKAVHKAVIDFQTAASQLAAAQNQQQSTAAQAALQAAQAALQAAQAALTTALQPAQAALTTALQTTPIDLTAAYTALRQAAQAAQEAVKQTALDAQKAVAQADTLIKTADSAIDDYMTANPNPNPNPPSP